MYLVIFTGYYYLLTSELLHGAGVSPIGRDNVYSHSELLHGAGVSPVGRDNVYSHG